MPIWKCEKCVGIISLVACIEREYFPSGIVALYYVLVCFTLITADRELERFFLFITLLLPFGSQLRAAQRQGCAIYDGLLKLLVRSLGKPQDRFRRFLWTQELLLWVYNERSNLTFICVSSARIHCAQSWEPKDNRSVTKRKNHSSSRSVVINVKYTNK